MKVIYIKINHLTKHWDRIGESGSIDEETKNKLRKEYKLFDRAKYICAILNRE